MNIIETRNLSKYYGKARGIIDLNLSVEQGDFFGYIGPNGAGKSTSIRTLLGLIQPSCGSASIFGKDICTEKKEILSEVGYLPSEAIFYSGMKVKDVLKLSANLRRKDCSHEAAILCERLNLDTEKKVEELSFGNRKKVGIVCAMQHKPSLYIMDEPTSGLDPLIQAEFFDMLKERNREGATVFFSSHVLSEIQKNCKSAAIIREGRLIACDKVEVLSRTNTKRVVLNGNVKLAGLSGVRDLKTEGEGTSFLYSGETDELIHFLSKFHLTNLSVSEPDLEEVFMHYYTDSEEGRDKP